MRHTKFRRYDEDGVRDRLVVENLKGGMAH
jgi:hypothetical protein